MKQGQRIRDDIACPSCGAKLDGWTSVGHDHEPKAGDFSICLYCRSLLRFTDSGLALATEADKESLAPEQRIQLVRLQQAAAASPFGTYKKTVGGRRG